MKGRAGAVFLLVLQLAGCYTWHEVGPTAPGLPPVTPRKFIQMGEPDRLRIVRTDGLRLDIRNPVVDQDSVRAQILGEEVVPVGPFSFGPHEVSVALTDIVSAEFRRDRTDVAVLVGALVAIPVGYLVVINVVGLGG